jgi:peptidoglycan/xylan/chitin deacetylase (PgdA/CDA1 family)
MNWEQARLLREGGMDIGSHAMTHACLASVPAERAYDELERSKKTIEEKLGEPVTLLAYPAGEHNQDVADLAAEAGYKAAFTTVTGSVRAGDAAFALRRIGVWSGGYDGVTGGFSAAVFGLQIGRLARRV